MRVTVKTICTCLFFCWGLFASAQKGMIEGKVLDGKTGEYLPGVTILLEGTSTGTITDLDGHFAFATAPGSYNVRVSFISYQTLHFNNVEVKANETTSLGEIRLEEATIELGEATVVAKFIRNTESAMLSMKKKAANVVDGISAAQLKKTGDSNMAASMKRVTGVSVSGGKYVYVRGLGDRYTKTTLNGLDIPGLDPDRNSLQMDIFPSGIVDHVMVAKSFSADQPADFTGGLVNMELKDFPEEKKMNASLSLAYNPGSHFRNDFVSYKGGSTDWLGFDDGTRSIPATENIPMFSEVVAQPNSTQGLRYQTILKGFNPVMGASREQSLMDFGVAFSMGNQVKVGKNKLGYFFSASYKNETDFYENAEYARYGLSPDPDETSLQTRELQQGDFGEETVLWSTLAGVAYKTAKISWRLNALHLQNGQKTAGIFNYQKSDLGTSFSGIQHNLEYNQRSLSSFYLDGKSQQNDKGWEMEWKANLTRSSNEDPDIRFVRYEDRNGQMTIGTEGGFPERIWRELKETNGSGAFDVKKNLTVSGREAALKMGAALSLKERDFVIRNYAINVRNIPLTGNPDELFAEENLWPYQGNIGRGTTYDAPFSPVNPNQYSADVQSGAVYALFRFSPLDVLEAIAGVRAETYSQRYTGQDQMGTNVLDNDKVLDETNLFPSLNLIFHWNERQNLRLSYGQTIARPSFRELSYAEIFDPITGRTFIGGLFRDADDIAGIEYWDGSLSSTHIRNFDFRWELFPGQNELIAASLFYKQFDKPIEMVEYATQTGSYQPRNVGDGTVLGAEFEFRKNLKFLSAQLEALDFSMNLTLVDSKIDMSKVERDSRVANARTGQTIGTSRAMAGQAPVIVNAALLYNGAAEGFGRGLTAGLFYNVQGSTLQYVGMVDRPDVYQLPFHSLNFNANKLLGRDQNLSVGFKIDNLLQERKELVYRSYGAGDATFSRLNPGTSFHVKVAYVF